MRNHWELTLKFLVSIKFSGNNLTDAITVNNWICGKII